MLRSTLNTTENKTEKMKRAFIDYWTVFVSYVFVRANTETLVYFMPLCSSYVQGTKSEALTKQYCAVLHSLPLSYIYYTKTQVDERPLDVIACFTEHTYDKPSWLYRLAGLISSSRLPVVIYYYWQYHAEPSKNLFSHLVSTKNLKQCPCLPLKI